MVSRTSAQYTPNEVIQKCSHITLDDLLLRDNPPKDLIPRISLCMQRADAYECGTHLLEWPDGCLVLVITKAKEFSKLRSEIVVDAYRKAFEGELFYRADFKMIKRNRAPALRFKLELEPLIGRGGWFAYITVICQFTSHNGNEYQVTADLKTTTPIDLTDYLLSPHRKTNDFKDTYSERQCISKMISRRLSELTSRKDWFKKRGYPIKFKTY